MSMFYYFLLSTRQRIKFNKMNIFIYSPVKVASIVLLFLHLIVIPIFLLFLLWLFSFFYLFFISYLYFFFYLFFTFFTFFYVLLFMMIKNLKKNLIICYDAFIFVFHFNVILTLNEIFIWRLFLWKIIRFKKVDYKCYRLALQSFFLQQITIGLMK